VNAYIYNADIYCKDCGKVIKQRINGAPFGRNDDTGRFESVDEYDGVDSDQYPCGPYADGGGEADCPQHCGDCRVFLENPLTAHGVQYVEEAINEHHRAGRGDADVLREWAEFYCLDFEKQEKADEAL
jgi:hypothetical protein